MAWPSRRFPWLLKLPWLIPFGPLLVIAGMFAPWVAHKAVALTITGNEFGEWVKFIPAVRFGPVHIDRLAFYLSWIAAGAALAWFIGIAIRSLMIRGLLLLPTAALCLPVFPPYPDVLTAYQGGEWRPQLLLGAIGLVAITFLGLFGRYLPRRVVLGLLGALCLFAAVYLALQVLPVWPLIAELYREPLQVGWGLIAVEAGLALLAVALLARALVL